MEIFCKAQSVTTGFQTSDGFLESFFICLTDTHDFTNGTHLSTQFIFCTFEFLECPSGEFNYHVISVRIVFIKSAVFTAWNFIQRKSCSQHCGYKGNRETGCFTCKS